MKIYVAVLLYRRYLMYLCSMSYLMWLNHSKRGSQRKWSRNMVSRKQTSALRHAHAWLSRENRRNVIVAGLGLLAASLPTPWTLSFLVNLLKTSCTLDASVAYGSTLTIDPLFSVISSPKVGGKPLSTEPGSSRRASPTYLATYPLHEHGNTT